MPIERSSSIFRRHKKDPVVVDVDKRSRIVARRQPVAKANPVPSVVWQIVAPSVRQPRNPLKHNDKSCFGRPNLSPSTPGAVPYGGPLFWHKNANHWRAVTRPGWDAQVGNERAALPAA